MRRMTLYTGTALAAMTLGGMGLTGVASAQNGPGASPASGGMAAWVQLTQGGAAQGGQAGRAQLQQQTPWLLGGQHDGLLHLHHESLFGEEGDEVNTGSGNCNHEFAVVDSPSAVISLSSTCIIVVSSGTSDTISSAIAQPVP